MKHINKLDSPAEFKDFVKNEHPTNWDDIHKSIKYPNLYQNCRYEILITEQEALGGYTERPILNSNSLHIDHFRKKGMPWPVDVTFDWNNLIVEEHTHKYGACYKDKKTSNISDYNKLINPVVDFPEQLMTYLPNGEIIPKSDINETDKDRVDFTIKRFNLNYDLLRIEREIIIKEILNSYKDLSDDDIREALRDSGYPTVVEWVLAVRHLYF